MKLLLNGKEIDPLDLIDQCVYPHGEKAAKCFDSVALKVREAARLAHHYGLDKTAESLYGVAVVLSSSRSHLPEALKAKGIFTEED